jgi:hypothetical protein
MQEEAKLRKDFHRAIQAKLFNSGLCSADGIIEDFKRTFLWNEMGVETSRALNLEQLQQAFKKLSEFPLTNIVNTLMFKFSKYPSPSSIVRCTEGQIKKIRAIAIYRMKLTEDRLFEYVAESCERRTYKLNITKTEADHLIKRLEAWETNQVRKGKL